MILYRAMCQSEYEAISTVTPLSWNSRFKWFGMLEFVTRRVQDGTFNNSKFCSDRYKHLVRYEVIKGLEHFSKCGYNEFMLDVRKQPIIVINLLKD